MRKFTGDLLPFLFKLPYGDLLSNSCLLTCINQTIASILSINKVVFRVQEYLKGNADNKDDWGTQIPLGSNVSLINHIGSRKGTESKLISMHQNVDLQSNNNLNLDTELVRDQKKASVNICFIKCSIRYEYQYWNQSLPLSLIFNLTLIGSDQIPKLQLQF